MSFRIAVVQPQTHAPPGDEANVADAVRSIERCAADGADFVCFPETYPGPWRMPAEFDPTGRLADAAAKHGVHAVFGTIEPISAQAATAFNLIVMAYPDGREPARYRRTFPNGPWLYTGGKYWEFQYVPGDEYPVFDTVHGKVGLAMCSEVYVPEVSRALALRGAELLFQPGGRCSGRVRSRTWRWWSRPRTWWRRTTAAWRSSRRRRRSSTKARSPAPASSMSAWTACASCGKAAMAAGRRRSTAPSRVFCRNSGSGRT
jgi:predicted amidohydrolase